MTTSRLQAEHPFPGDTVPTYRYKTYWTDVGGGTIENDVSAGAGSMTTTELTTGSLGAIEWDAATDDHAMMIWLPSDCDVNAPIQFRLVWSSTETSEDEYTWVILYREISFNSTDGFNTAPTGTLDTAIVADTGTTTADGAQTTAWGTLNGGTLSGSEPDYCLHLLIDPSAMGGTISADVVLLWAVQVKYQPKTM